MSSPGPSTASPTSRSACATPSATPPGERRPPKRAPPSPPSSPHAARRPSAPTTSPPSAPSTWRGPTGCAGAAARRPRGPRSRRGRALRGHLRHHRPRPRAPGTLPPSYPGQAWPADAVVAAASLRLHDTLLPPRHGATLQRWLAAVDAARDAYGLIPHSAHSRHGGTPARGSSQALILRFLYEIDPDRALADYRLFRRRHVTTVALLPAIREYALGMEGRADVDSGPLIGGASAPAMVVGMGTAQLFSDRALVDPLLHTLEFVGFPLPFGGKRYAFGMLPVGDAFLAWSKTATPWTRPVHREGWPEVVSAGYRLPWHALLVLLLGLVWLGPVRRWLRGH
ncbi:MAG: hypothetical protein R3F60_12465 [bacterium]